MRSGIHIKNLSTIERITLSFLISNRLAPPLPQIKESTDLQVPLGALKAPFP
jgi:hypothetical protein